MKFHVFIATTQGLVTIQDVIPLNDPDIHSLISVNGTATVANISANYHHFVKKGSGLIHQDFSCCSYRINISKGIDQGNSWQLGIYLAHSLAHQNLLATGNVQENDQIIIATGEVNTTSRQVQSIQHVQEKYNQIIHFNNAQKQKVNIPTPVFLMPKTDLSSLNLTLNNHAAKVVDIVGIAHLSELQTKIAELTSATKGKPTTSEYLDKIKNSTERKYLGLTKLAWLIVFVLVVSTTLLGVYVNENNHQNKNSLTSELASTQTEHSFNAPQINNSVKDTIKNKPTNAVLESIRLKVLKTKYSDCSEQTYHVLLKPEDKRFSAENRYKLCQLSVISSKNVKQVYWLDNNKTSLLALEKSNVSDALTNQENNTSTEQEWVIPLPSKQQRDVSYYLIVFFNHSKVNNLALNNTQFNEIPINNTKIFTEQLNAFLSKDVKSPKVSYKAITTWLKQHYADSELYQHTLEIF